MHPIFLGIDLGWVNGASGLAALEFARGKLRLRSLELGKDHAEVLAWVRDQAGDRPAIAAVDAPTIIRNAAGQRPGERELNAAYRKFGLNCHPANLGRPFAAKTNAFSQALEDLGFQHGAAMQPQAPGRFQLEVFPHAAIVRLFDLDYRLLYKKGSVAERVNGLKTLRRLLYQLRNADPSLPLKGLPEVPAGGIARKNVEDRLDAIVCAYTAAHYWWWGKARNEVFGNPESGFLVVPRPVRTTS